MLVSVVIPSYNRSSTLVRALESVYAQTWLKDGGSLQVFVVDDGSDDDTALLVKKHFPQARYIYQENAGVSSARNTAIQQCSGDWIALLDSDDEWLPHKLTEQFKLLEQSGLLICHTEEIWVRNGKRVNQLNKHQKYGGWIYPHCLPLCAMSPSSIVIHRSVFDHVGLFDEALPVCEDYEMWLRLSANYEVAFVAQPAINKYGGHADQLSRQHWGMDRFRVIALEKILRTELPADLQAATIDMLLRKLKILLTGAAKHQNSKLQIQCRQQLDYWQRQTAQG